MSPQETNKPSAVCFNGMVDCCAALRCGFSEMAQKPRIWSKIYFYSSIENRQSLTVQKALRVHGLYRWHTTERSHDGVIWSRASSIRTRTLKALASEWSV